MTLNRDRNAWTGFCLSWRYLAIAAQRVQWARALGYRTFHGISLKELA